MNRSKKLLFATALFAIVVAGMFTYSAKAKESPIARFGACYTLYDCQGGSIGSFEEAACRNMGGHSMNSGGICFNL